MAYIGFVIDRQYASAACGRSTAELHITLAHIPTGAKPSLQDELPGQLLVELDTLWAYTKPQAMTLDHYERFGSILVRRAYGKELEDVRKLIVSLLDSYKVRYSNDYGPWVPHCSIGINCPEWRWLDVGGSPYMSQSVAVHSSRAVLAGLKGVVAHHWDLGTALRSSVSPTTITED